MTDNTAERQLDVMERVIAKAERYKGAMRETVLSGVPFGHSRLTDEQWRVWFSTLLAKNPWKLLWLPVIENGPEQLKRYSKITGVEDAYSYLYAGLFPPVAPQQAAPPDPTAPAQSSPRTMLDVLPPNIAPPAAIPAEEELRYVPEPAITRLAMQQLAAALAEERRP